MLKCVCVYFFNMAKPQLALIDELVKNAKRLKRRNIAPSAIMRQLDTLLIVKHGYSRTTRNDYLHRVKIIVWGQTT